MSLAGWKGRLSGTPADGPAYAKPAKPAKAGTADSDPQASANAKPAKPANVPAASPPDLAPGWQRRLAVDKWEAEWLAIWERGGRDIASAQLPGVVTNLVTLWNARTGDRHTPAEFLAQLSDADRTDPAICNAAWLALYAATLWREAGQADDSTHPKGSRHDSH